jgi:L-asparaginase/Glu-tRNA(Gln) amidotransferase subunit D
VSHERPRIAVFAGPDATILNSQPLVTSNTARRSRGLPPRAAPDGWPLPFDVLRPQRLAAPVTVYVEQFSAHPLEADAVALYGPPDGYVDGAGTFHPERTGSGDTPVYALTLSPEDGLLPLPYPAFQADGRPWEGDEADPFGPPERARQPFYPDASRVFEEIDRLGVGDDGLGGQLARLADYEFVRPAPPAGYTRSGEARGTDFWAYRPPHLIRQPSRPVLARLTNGVATTLASGRFAGGLWLEGSPYLEETAYWLSLLLDTQLPLAACAAQRPHGAVGDDGARNLIDAVRYLVSRAWTDPEGRDRLGPVVVMDQRILAARSVQKADARPGGYVATGPHGGALGTITSIDRVVVAVTPVWRHTWSSEVRRSALPERVQAARRSPDGSLGLAALRVRHPDGALDEDAIPSVAIAKYGQYGDDDATIDPTREVGIAAHAERVLSRGGLGGLVVEGSAPFGTVGESVEAVLRTATFSGLPVVKVGRGDAGGVTEGTYAPFAIAGGDLTATKARLLLMASLMKLGSLPPAADPLGPIREEQAATRTALDRFQAIFDTH